MKPLLLALAFLISCLSYSSIQKTDDYIYLSGAKGFGIFSSPFLKRCTLNDTVLDCVEINEPKPENNAGSSGGPGGGNNSTTEKDETKPNTEPAPADTKTPPKSPSAGA